MKKNITLSLVLLFSLSVLQAQSKMPSDSYQIINKANALMFDDSDEALKLLKPLKEIFNSESNYDDFNDVVIYNAIVSSENSIHASNKKYIKVYEALNEIQKNIKPYVHRDDRYTMLYFGSKSQKITFLVLEKGDFSDAKNELSKLIKEVKNFQFKDKSRRDMLVMQFETLLADYK